MAGRALGGRTTMFCKIIHAGWDLCGSMPSSRTWSSEMFFKMSRASDGVNTRRAASPSSVDSSSMMASCLGFHSREITMPVLTYLGCGEVHVPHRNRPRPIINI